MLPSSEAPELPGHLEAGRPLDEAVAATIGCPGRWGWAAATPFLAVLGILVVLPLVIWGAGLPTTGDVTQLYNLLAGLALGAAVLAAARRLAARCGGWTAAIGLGRPQRSDAKRIVVWFFLQLGVRILAGIVLHVLAPDLPPGGNLGDVGDLGPVGAALLLVTAVVVAPIVEEVAFRGVLLRALMRRLPFWPAAALSSFLFALLHVPGADTLGGSVQVAATIYAFALVQCELVRRTGRLAPAIGVHATINLLATGAALLGS